jgi:putative ABC transport system permease protein
MIGAGLESGWEALWANRLRSLLTVLGVIVGVAAVIAVVTLTQGTSELLNSRLTGLGTNVLTITPGSTTTGGAAGGLGTRQSLTQDDATAVASVPNITGVTGRTGTHACKASRQPCSRFRTGTWPRARGSPTPTTQKERRLR